MILAYIGRLLRILIVNKLWSSPEPGIPYLRVVMELSGGFGSKLKRFAVLEIISECFMLKITDENDWFGYENDL